MTQRVSRPLTAVLLALTVLFAGAAVGAASSHTTDQQNVAYLAVFHASPDAPAVDVYVDNQSVLDGVAFGDISEYLKIPAGPHTVTITVAGDREAVVFEGDVTAPRGTVATVAATGEVSQNGTTEFAPRVYADDALTPEKGYAAVRIAHLSPDAPTVDVTAKNGKVVLAENVSFGDASAYVTVPAGDYDVEIRADTPNANGTVVTTVHVSVDSREAYTAWAVGYLSPESAPADTPFQVVLNEDATRTIRLP